MRKIRYRGKDIENDNEWRYGSLITYPNGKCVIVTFDNDYNELSYDVNPHTVGQFTEVTDWTYKEIYEGDIIKDRNENPFNGNYVVRWNNLYSRIICNSTKTDGFLCLSDFADPLIIGNIHDNPELLNGDTTMTYNADITHCSGYLCPLAERCRRAQLSQIWANTPIDKRPIYVSFTSAKYDNRRNRCGNFLEIK